MITDGPVFRQGEALKIEITLAHDHELLSPHGISRVLTYIPPRSMGMLLSSR